ncbi:sugar 3,4-ketoisomerase [Bacillus sp. CGMCC 1.16607]|uniref:sugar 3,4-ketoisomerase n=1 Tax=Bacillus sp. CGMCC 1.16607 TaxID=3351842 RepID=UPI00363FDE7C
MINELKKSELTNFAKIEDVRGILISLEALRDIIFEIKRVYYIYNTKANLSRGFHAHKNLQQQIICVSGSCEVVLDNGKEKRCYHLNEPHQGLFVDKMIWHEMHNFSENCVLIVLASDYYNEEDYIRDYEDFIAHKGAVIPPPQGSG